MDPTWIEIGDPREIEAAKHPNYPNNPPVILPDFLSGKTRYSPGRKKKTSKNANELQSKGRKRTGDRNKNISRDGRTIHDKSLSSTNGSHIQSNSFSVLKDIKDGAT